MLRIMKQPMIIVAALCIACTACAQRDMTNVVPYPGTTKPSMPALQTYSDTDFGFSFAYPSGAKVLNECGPGLIPCGNFVLMTDTYDNSPFTLAIDDGTIYEDREFATEYKNIMVSAKTYAERLHWQNLAEKDPTSPFYNKNVANKTVGPLEKIRFAGQEAYSFHMTEAFAMIGFEQMTGGYLFTPPSDFIILKHDGRIFVLRLSTGDGVAGIVSGNFTFL